MKRKLISLICALSMIATMFSAFAVVKADSTPSIQGTAVKSGNTVNLTVSISGYDKVSTLQFLVPIDTEVFTLTNSEVVAPFDDENCNPNATGGYKFVWSKGQPAKWVDASSSTDVLKLTLTVKDGKEAPDKIELSGIVSANEKPQGTNPETYETEKFNADNPLTSQAISIIDPDAPTPAVDRPASKGSDPIASVTGPQLNGRAELSADGSTATVTYSVKDFDMVSTLQFLVPIDTDKYTLTKSEVKAPFDDENCNPNATGGYKFVWSKGQPAKWVDGSSSVDVLELTFALTDAGKAAIPFNITPTGIVAANEQAQGTDPETYETEKFNADNLLGVTPATVKGETASFDKNDIAIVGDVLEDEAADLIGDDDTADGNTPYYVVVKATDKNGDPATYGDDYVAYYDGVELTEDQLTDYLAGRHGSVKDALEKITFAANKGVTIAAELDKTGNKYPLATGDVTVPSGKATPTPKPTTAPTMSIVTTAGGKVTNKVTEKSILTAIVDVPEKLQVGGAYLLDYLDVDKDGYLELISSKVDEDGLGATFKFQALKAGKVTLTAYYVAEEDDGDDDDTNLVATKTTTLATAKTTVQITKESSSSGSSSSSSSDKSTSSGGGAIALGNQKGTTGNYPGTTNFPDIEGVSSWAGPAIARLAAEGIVAGRDDGTFDPDANITRAEYCQMLVQTINKSGVYADVNYDDVPTDAWFYHAVAVASSLGIVEGFGDNTFHPYELITREQMARMTMAATQVQGIYLNSVQSVSFSDDADIADWSRDSVYTLAEAGVINGMDDGSYFAPRANATRAQAAVIIYKAFFEGK